MGDNEGMRGMLSLLKQTWRDFSDDECGRMAAAMSYFMAFSLPPLLVLILMLVGLLFDPADVQGRIESEMGRLLGGDGARMVQEMINAANRPQNRGVLPALMGIVVLLFGATGAFGQLQAALNRAWEVKPDPKAGGWKRFIGKRLLSLGMVLTIAFLLMVSLVLDAALTAFGDSLGNLMGGVPDVLLQGLHIVVSLATITALFAVMFKYMPDARIGWRDVGVGALFTALLFQGGKLVIGLYLARSDPGSAFGAAGALAVILVWLYYSSMIVFLGAEFTQVWATEKGKGIEPEEGAIRTDEHRRENRAEKEPRRGEADEPQPSVPEKGGTNEPQIAARALPRPKSA
jgi:membrane protein